VKSKQNVMYKVVMIDYCSFLGNLLKENGMQS